MKPLQGRASHVVGGDGQALLVGDLVKMKEVAYLEQPAKNVVSGKYWNIDLW